MTPVRSFSTSYPYVVDTEDVHASGPTPPVSVGPKDGSENDGEENRVGWLDEELDEME